MPVFKSPSAMPATPHDRRAPGPRIVLATGVFLVLFPVTAVATEPTTDAINCLSAVLTGANNAVSVKTIDDVPYDLGNGVKGVKKGVEYAFRDASGAPQVIGIYLSSQFKPECPAQGVCMSFNVTWVQTDNHRYSLSLREPFPSQWYPPALEVHPSSHETDWRRQDSPAHPLFGLWRVLGARCSIDNLEINSPRTP